MRGGRDYKEGKTGGKEERRKGERRRKLKEKSIHESLRGGVSFQKRNSLPRTGARSGANDLLFGFKLCTQRHLFFSPLRTLKRDKKESNTSSKEKEENRGEQRYPQNE